MSYGYSIAGLINFLVESVLFYLLSSQLISTTLYFTSQRIVLVSMQVARTLTTWRASKGFVVTLISLAMFSGTCINNMLGHIGIADVNYN